MRRIKHGTPCKVFFAIIIVLHFIIGCEDDDEYYRSAQQRAADFIASQIRANPDFIYEDYFDESFRKTMPENDLKDLLALIYTRHGPCEKAVLGSPQVGDGGRQNYFLIFMDKRRGVIPLLANPENGLIQVFSFQGSIPADDYFHIEEFFVPMADGTFLRTLVFQKQEERRPKPTVLTRTPYFENDGLFSYSLWYETAAYFLERDYSFVLQSIRGRSGSGGIYRYLSPGEIDDGYETIQWIAGQDFSDGNVGITGTSADGFTALAAGIRNPAPLKVIMAGGAPSNIDTGSFRPNGPINTLFLNYIGYNELQKGSFPITAFGETIKATVLNEPDLRRYDELVYGSDLTEWNRISEAYPDPDAPFWKEREIFSRLPEIQIPTWHISGMAVDGDLPDTVRNFVTIQENSPFFQNHRMILGYWDHGDSTAYFDGRKMKPFMKERFDPLMAHFLKNEPTDYVFEPRVQMASNLSQNFLGADEWPLPQLHEATCFFNRNGDELTLDKVQSSTIEESKYLFKPFLQNSFAPGDEQCLHFLLTPNERLNILGPMKLKLYIRINTPQTDIFALFQKLDVTGKKADFTKTPLTQKVVNTQGVIILELESPPIMNVMEPGEKLYIILTSNYFPTFFRNRNNDIGPGYYDDFSEAEITILHSTQYPSQVIMSLE
jgi:predicted acyl esterase